MKTIATIFLVTGLALNAFAGGGDSQPPRYVEPLRHVEPNPINEICQQRRIEVGKKYHLIYEEINFQLEQIDANLVWEFREDKRKTLLRRSDDMFIFRKENEAAEREQLFKIDRECRQN